MARKVALLLATEDEWTGPLSEHHLEIGCPMLALLLVLVLVLLAAVVVPLALAVRRDGYSPVAFDRAHDSRGGGA